MVGPLVKSILFVCSGVMGDLVLHTDLLAEGRRANLIMAFGYDQV